MRGRILDDKGERKRQSARKQEGLRKISIPDFVRIIQENQQQLWTFGRNCTVPHSTATRCSNISGQFHASKENENQDGGFIIRTRTNTHQQIRAVHIFTLQIQSTTSTFCKVTTIFMACCKNISECYWRIIQSPYSATTVSAFTCIKLNQGYWGVIVGKFLCFVCLHLKKNK